MSSEALDIKLLKNAIISGDEVKYEKIKNDHPIKL